MAYTYRKRGPLTQDKPVVNSDAKQPRLDQLRRCYICNKPSHLAIDCHTKNMTSQASTSKTSAEVLKKPSPLTCFSCGEQDHVYTRCPRKQKAASEAVAERRVDVCTIKPASDQLSTYNVNLGTLTAGISMAWPSPMIVKLYNGTETLLSRPITEEEGSWIVSGGYLIAIVTNLLGGILIDQIGRKYCIILVTIPRIFVSIWTIFVTEVWMLIVCRVVMLISDSLIYVVVAVYISEIACKEHRGSLGTFLQINSCVGIVTTFIVGPFLTYGAFNAFLATAVLVSFLVLPFLPQSPVYLHSKGRIDEAIQVLSEIRESYENVRQELEDYKSSKQIKVDKIALLKNKTFLKSLSLGSLICAGTSGIGYNATLFYMQTILKSSNTTVKPEIASAVIGCVQIFAAICSCILTKKFGRRPIMIYSILGMLIGMVCLGTFFKINSTEGYAVTSFLSYLPVTSLMLCTYSFNVGIGCLVFVVTVELFDGPARAFGCSMCWGWTFLLDFLTSKYFAEATSTLGPSETYWFFSFICLLFVTLITFFLPETKGKTFSEIQISLGSQEDAE